MALDEEKAQVLWPTVAPLAAVLRQVVSFRAAHLKPRRAEFEKERAAKEAEGEEFKAQPLEDPTQKSRCHPCPAQASQEDRKPYIHNLRTAADGFSAGAWPPPRHPFCGACCAALRRSSRAVQGCGEGLRRRRRNRRRTSEVCIVAFGPSRQRASLGEKATAMT